MANEIYDVDGNASGTQTMGSVVVNTGGRGSNLKQTYDPSDVDTLDISEITDKYEDRLDDPRYYEGDTAS